MDACALDFCYPPPLHPTLFSYDPMITFLLQNIEPRCVLIQHIKQILEISGFSNSDLTALSL